MAKIRGQTHIPSGRIIDPTLENPSKLFHSSVFNPWVGALVHISIKGWSFMLAHSELVLVKRENLELSVNAKLQHTLHFHRSGLLEKEGPIDTRRWKTWWSSARRRHAADSVHLPPTYIRPTVGCRRGKQARPCSESFPSLVLTHAVHNWSRQWATLNYSGSGSANTTALTLDWESWNEKPERPKFPTCTSAHTWTFVWIPDSSWKVRSIFIPLFVLFIGPSRTFSADLL